LTWPHYRYGFKASRSGRACRPPMKVTSVPDIPSTSRSFASTLRPLRSPRSAWHCVQVSRRVRGPLCERPRLSTPGALGSGSRSVVMSHRRLLRPHPSVSRARGDFAASGLYPASSLCGHASATRETFPTFTAVLSTRAIDPTPAGSRDLSHCVTVRDARLPRSLSESPPASDRLCQQYLTALCISTLYRSLHATARVFAQPSWLAATRWSHVRSTGLSEDLCHSRFSRRSLPTGAGSQARWSNGKLPSSGLAPDKSQQLARIIREGADFGASAW